MISDALFFVHLPLQIRSVSAVEQQERKKALLGIVPWMNQIAAVLLIAGP